ncbi:MAG TPA: phenylalanine--tRNA ligase subunit alpha [Candidatus Paceibacterota bacterium]|nr:phenylalanine--tRNA ligase subunit alpha [Candidatus Paceibacterota bacterium]
METDKIRKEALAELEKAGDAASIEKLQVKYLGRKGEISLLLRTLKDLSVDERRKLGPKLQSLKNELEGLFSNRLAMAASDKQQATRVADLTAPGKKVSRGHLHPLTLVDADIRKIFTSMNFSVVEGPEVETEYYNFDALNVPEFHPAREMWDTFWLKPANGKLQMANGRSNKPSAISDKLLLRTHTSPVQIRYMEKNKPPFQIIAPGRTFRYEATDASHEVNFYQLEGLMVGKDVSLANFKFVVEEFFKRFFARQKIEFRYRPSYFPFVEPGVEVIIKLNNKWLEVMGAGMVHPRVFEYAGYNPRDWQGFAFGVGIDRLAMIKYKIPDIRMFYSGDLRFIKQF